MKNELRSVCPHDCPDTCGIIPYVKDGKLVKVKGDPDHILTRGFLCQKVMNYPERVYGPDRLADMGGGSTYNTNLVQIERVNDDKI
jgi:anaerobic selenocysteine-containing dehydrogenase